MKKKYNVKFRLLEDITFSLSNAIFGYACTLEEVVDYLSSHKKYLYFEATPENPKDTIINLDSIIYIILDEVEE